MTTKLPTTEKRNKKSENIDKLSTTGIVKLLNSEDRLVAPAVGKEYKNIAKAVDVIVERFKRGGRLFYVGAGTSGRLGVLDASECPPTFGVSPLLVQGIIAGGERALTTAVEGAEDRIDEGIAAIKKRKITKNDVVVGIAACGLTPFVRAALKQAQKTGTAAIFITCSPENIKGIPAQIIINPVVGAEVITGSTRMKAGTATKLVLNTLTTAAMIKMGKVFGNLMVDLKATNNKLKKRSVRIICQTTGLSEIKAAALLKRADGKVKVGIVMHHRKVNLKRAMEILEENCQSLRKSIK
ncbi:MAG: N-acetylmuramic acid 6-phosphate etherase [Phycisphaerae bacterium]|jgi:N-acetylmuramic acid 6-phosphate etherase